ncbi:MAG: RES family NAD+ phosphorylase [Gammaproteobacteria bacterium]|nr:RES family NAD+ phosphorylase [Gammaproteobacteria bacterium]
MDELFSKVTIADTHENLVRNIISLRKSEDLFDDLSDDPSEQEVAVRLEIDTKPPHYTSEVPIINRPFEEAAFFEAIGFPFTNWTESRFSNGKFGIWYGADSIETTVYETVFHWRRFLADADFETEGSIVERKIWKVRCDAALLDFRSLVREFQLLTDKTNYHFTQTVGDRLHHEGHPGLVSRSARCEGDIYGVLNRDVLSNQQNYCYLTYQIIEERVTIERDPGITFLTIE